MPKKAKKGKNAYSRDDLWIAPSYSLKRPKREGGWEIPRGESSPTSRFLELADIALGFQKPKTSKKKRAAAA
jgi:hypothetical protein